MRFWNTIANRFYPGRRRAIRAQYRLTEAYREVFQVGNESAEMVISDLANFTGYYKVPPPGTPSETLQYEAGMRAAFGRLFHFLTLSDEQRKALERAVRQESDADNEEGTL